MSDLKHVQVTMSREDNEIGRVEVLPVQWRKHLTLEVSSAHLQCCFCCRVCHMHALQASITRHVMRICRVVSAAEFVICVPCRQALHIW